MEKQIGPSEKVGVAILAFVLGWLIANGKQKAQWVRLLDILVYGPFYFGSLLIPE